MKKVTAIIGNQQKHATYKAVCEFEARLRTYGEIEFEYIFLKDYRLEFCRGCKVCFSKGEEFCPLKDDRDVLIGKMENSDGVIMATPNYAFHVSASMKNLLDRLAYVFHRPQFFGKTYTAVVNQGIHGGKGIVKYLSSSACPGPVFITCWMTSPKITGITRTTAGLSRLIITRHL